MSLRTGPGPLSIKAAAAVADTSVHAMTAFRAQGNCTKAMVTTGGGGGCGSITFTAETSPDKGTTYYDVIDRDSVWSQVCTSPDTAGNYIIDLEGLHIVPGDYVRLSYKCATAAGTLAVSIFNWEDPKGGGISVSVPDVVVDVDSISVNIAAVEQVHDAAVGASGFMQVVEAATIDGSALPNAVSEGDVVRPKAEKTGNLLVSIVSQDGSYIQPVGDVVGRSMHTAIGDGTTTAVVETDGTKKAVNVNITDGTNDMPTGDALARSIFVNVGDGTTTAVVETDGTKKALNVNITDGTNDMPTMDANTRAGFVKITDGTTDATVNATTGGVETDIVGVGGAAYALGAAEMAASQPVTLATDDMHLGAVGAASDVDGVVHGQLRFIGESVDGLETDLTACATSLAIIDDWDESDRAKVNPIVGQAGVAAGSGAVDALTQRVILATDDPAVTLLGTIDADTSTIAGDTTSIDAKTPALGSAVMTGSSPVTLAMDDIQFGAVGEASDADGNIHGQLRFIAEAVGGVASTVNRVVTNATGAGSGTLATTAHSANADLKSITIKFDGALAAAETISVTLDANDGASYDAVLYSYDLGTAGGTSFNWIPSTPIPLESGDEVIVSLSANTNNRTYGLRIVADKV